MKDNFIISEVSDHSKKNISRHISYRWCGVRRAVQVDQGMEVAQEMFRNQHKCASAMTTHGDFI